MMETWYAPQWAYDSEGLVAKDLSHGGLGPCDAE